MTITIILTSFAEVHQTTIAACPLATTEISVRYPRPLASHPRPLVGGLAWLVLSFPADSGSVRIEADIQDDSASGWWEPTEVFPPLEDIPFGHVDGYTTRVFEFSPNSPQLIRIIFSEAEITISAFTIPRRGVKEFEPFSERNSAFSKKFPEIS